MATPQNCEPSKVIGSISKFAGTLVGTAVVAGKRIIGSVAPPSKGSSNKPVGKTMKVPAKRRKKAVRKTATKVPKTKKKKVVTPKKKTTSRKTKKKAAKSEGASHSQDTLSS